MKKVIQDIYDDLKDKALVTFHTTGVAPSQAVAITQDLVRIPFDRIRSMVPACMLGIADKGYCSVPQAISEGFIIAVFVVSYGVMAKHELFAIKPDFLYLDERNFLWFELNSRITNIREAFYIDHSQEPPKLQVISNELFDKVVENDIMDHFKLHS